jgi:hypothetical protein
MLIKAYGEFWNPFLTDWAGQKLEGRAKLQVTRDGEKKTVTHTINFWKATGIYVLYNDFNPVYVGKTTVLGKRIADHLSDRFAGRWDMFSWYSVCKPNTSSGGVGKAVGRKVSVDSVISTLETLGIFITDPALNRKRESIPGASRFDQFKAKSSKTVREYLEQILEKL